MPLYERQKRALEEAFEAGLKLHGCVECARVDLAQRLRLMARAAEQEIIGPQGEEGAFEGEVFHKMLIMYDFFPGCFSCSPLASHAAFGMAIAGSQASSSHGGTDGQGSGTKRPCGKGS